MTTTAKPTPGPWRVQNGPVGITVRRVSDDRPVAEIWLNGDGLDTLLATARLIAAAPDLADALRQVLPFAEEVLEARKRWEFSSAGKSLTNVAQAAVDVIRAALAKLEG